MVIAVITPTYKEEDNIAPLIESILAQKPRLPHNSTLHIIVSDSHSPDHTRDVTLSIAKQNKNVHYLDCKVRGIGVGIVEGFRYAIKELHADILIQIDADLSHPPTVIPTMIENLESGYDLVCASRYAKGGSNGYGLYRSFQSYCANQFCRLVLGIYSLHEFMTSYRAMRRETFEKVNLNKVPWKAKSFVFQAAFVYELIRSGAKFIEVPIQFKDRVAGRSKMNTYLYIKELILYGIKTRIKRHKQFVKFLVVGGTGFLINTTMLLLFVELFGIYKPLSSALGAEVAIVSNFILNNTWTFKHSKIHRNNALIKFLQFNLSSFGAIAIQYIVVWFGEHYINPFLPFSANVLDNIYLVYYVIAVGIGLIYNYFMYSRVIWKKSPAQV